MKQLLEDIFILEEREEFEKVFDLYSNAYSNSIADYDIWKHFYFFLWIAIEDAPSNFHDKINLRQLLQDMFDEGKKHFIDIADFNFIAGYTVSIFPYEYGEYDCLEQEGHRMLLKATQLEPDNLIYKLAYLGSCTINSNQKYRQVEVDAAPKVLETFSGNGLLNKYFRQVLYRIRT